MDHRPIKRNISQTKDVDDTTSSPVNKKPKPLYEVISVEKTDTTPIVGELRGNQVVNALRRVNWQTQQAETDGSSSHDKTEEPVDNTSLSIHNEGKSKAGPIDQTNNTRIQKIAWELINHVTTTDKKLPERYTIQDEDYKEVCKELSVIKKAGNITQQVRTQAALTARNKRASVRAAQKVAQRVAYRVPPEQIYRPSTKRTDSQMQEIPGVEIFDGNLQGVNKNAQYNVNETENALKSTIFYGTTTFHNTIFETIKKKEEGDTLLENITIEDYKKKEKED